MSYATTLDEVLALRSENFTLRDRLGLACKERDIMRDMLLNPDPAPAASVREADQKVLADLDTLIRSEQTGSRSTMQIAMAAEREIRRLASLPAPAVEPEQDVDAISGCADDQGVFAQFHASDFPAPEAAPTREEIADPSNVQEVVAAFEHLRKKMRGDTKGEELAAFARVDRAILALKAAPAK